jgi:hypothetical protein
MDVNYSLNQDFSINRLYGKVNLVDIYYKFKEKTKID